MHRYWPYCYAFASQKTEEKVRAPEPVPPTEETSVPATTATTQPAETKPEAKTQAMTTAKTAEPSGSVTSSTKTTAGRTETSAASKTPSPTPKPATPAPASSGNYFIQVGAFNDRASARLEVEKYRKQGYNAVVKEPFPKDRRPLYRVWLGSFKSRDEAQKVLNDLKSKSVRNSGFFIIQQ